MIRLPNASRHPCQDSALRVVLRAQRPRIALARRREIEEVEVTKLPVPGGGRVGIVGAKEKAVASAGRENRSRGIVS